MIRLSLCDPLLISQFNQIWLNLVSVMAGQTKETGRIQARELQYIV